MFPLISHTVCLDSLGFSIKRNGNKKQKSSVVMPVKRGNSRRHFWLCQDLCELCNIPHDPAPGCGRSAHR